jgi:membrane-bound ClpP family serine protease
MARTTHVHREANLLVSEQLKKNAEALELAMNGDVLTWWGPIQPPVDQLIRQAVEYRMKSGDGNRRRKRLAVILQTPGGYIETAERISDTLRTHYPWVAFIIPNIAMSAGTVLAMSGDEIWMDYFSILGPIDPQVEKISPDGSRKGLVPALGYLIKYNELVEKSRRGTLTSAEAAFFIQNFDAAELYSYEQAKNLSIALLKQWLVKYKFKNWKRTTTRRLPVTPRMRRERAEEIGTKLSDTNRWYSHSRGISMNVLQRDLKLKIENIDGNPRVRESLDNYYGLLTDYLGTIQATGALHTGDRLVPLA